MNKPLEPIVCQRCKERRPPSIQYGVYCESCWRELEAELDARLSKGKVSSIFTRNDGSIYD